MIRRPSRALPAGLVALVGLATCVVVVLSLVQRLTGAREFVSYDGVVNRLAGTDWGDGRVAVLGGAAVLAGIVLLGLAAPGRPEVVLLAAADGISAGVARRTVRGALADAARSVEGVHSVRITLRRKTVRVRARVAGERSAERAESIRAAVDERVARIGSHPAPRISTRLRRGSVR